VASTIKRRHSTQPARFPNAAKSFHSQLATLSSLNSPYLYSNVVISTGPNCCHRPERCLRDSAQIVRSIPNGGNSQQCPTFGGYRPHKPSMLFQVLRAHHTLDPTSAPPDKIVEDRATELACRILRTEKVFRRADCHRFIVQATFSLNMGRPQVVALLPP
jgi:hypothetical protein